MAYLAEGDVAILNWENSPMDIPNQLRGSIYRRGVKGDGSCYFHSILYSFNDMYIKNKSQRTSLALRFRESLVPKLKKHYQTLGGGNLRELGQFEEEFTIEGLSKLLLSMSSVGDSFRELISRELNINIFIVDIARKDLYITGDNIKEMYKERNSVVLAYLPGHYESIVLKSEDDNYNGYFLWNNLFIQTLYKRALEVCAD